MLDHHKKQMYHDHKINHKYVEEFYHQNYLYQNDIVDHSIIGAIGSEFSSRGTRPYSSTSNLPTDQGISTDCSVPWPVVIKRSGSISFSLSVNICTGGLGNSSPSFSSFKLQFFPNQ